MSKRYSYCQGTLDVGDAPPPSLLEDDEIDLKDLATVPYVERAPLAHYCDASKWCSGTSALIDEGLFLSWDGVTRFHRWWCSECGASRPDGHTVTR